MVGTCGGRGGVLRRSTSGPLTEGGRTCGSERKRGKKCSTTHWVTPPPGVFCGQAYYLASLGRHSAVQNIPNKGLTPKIVQTKEIAPQSPDCGLCLFFSILSIED